MAIGPLQIFLILLIVILLFGTKKLRNVGSDLGGAIKNFKKSVKDVGDDSATPTSQIEENKGETFDAQFEEKKEEEKK